MTAFTSYAQNFEDVLLMRAFADVTEGVYLDIGAQDPTEYSVSKTFFEASWHGIHVEPVPEYAQKLRDERPGDLIIQARVGENKDQDFHVVENTGLSTSDPILAEHHAQRNHVRTIRPDTKSLADIFSTLENDLIHWMKIDVEGAEADVLKSWGTSKIRPQVLCIEAIGPLSHEKNHEAWGHEVISRGYIFTYFDGLNRFYVHRDYPNLIDPLSYGPTILDTFILNENHAYLRATNIGARHQGLMQSNESQKRRMAELDDAIRAGDKAQFHFRNRITGLETELKKLDNLQPKYDQLEKELSISRTEIFMKISQIENLNRNLETANQQIKFLDKKIKLIESGHHYALKDMTRNVSRDWEKSQNMILEGHHNLRDQLIGQHAQHINALHEHIENQDTALRDAYLSLERIGASTSWRVTAPVRHSLTFIKKFIRKIFNLPKRVGVRIIDYGLYFWRQDVPALRGVRQHINRRESLSQNLSQLAKNRDEETEYAPLKLSTSARPVLRGHAQNAKAWRRILRGKF